MDKGNRGKLYAGDVWQDGYHAHRVVDRSDFDSQLGYIANNPGRKNYANYPFVHTVGRWRIDPVPDYLACR